MCYLDLFVELCRQWEKHEHLDSRWRRCYGRTLSRWGNCHMLQMIYTWGVKYIEASWFTILIFLLKGFCDSKHHTDFSSETCYCSLLTQVLDVISRKPELTKISFLAHSVGGLVARYAIAKLYRHPNSTFDSKAEGTICGLEAVNFITVATPHLGSRGNKQVLCWLFSPYFSTLTFMWVQICLFETMRMTPVSELIHSHLLIYVPVFLCEISFVFACL